MAVSSTLYLGLKGVDITLTLVMRVKGGGRTSMTESQRTPTAYRRDCT